MLHVTKLKRGRNSLGPLLFSVLYFKVTIMSVWTQVHVLGCSHLAVEYFWMVWARGRGGAGVLPYMGYIGMCRCEGYGF